MKGNSAAPGGPLTSKPTWLQISPSATTSAFFLPGRVDRRATSAFKQQKTGQAATSVTAGRKQVSRSLGIRRTTMVIFADFVLQPGGIVAWIVLGLIAGFLAGKVMSGSGYGVL